MIFLKCGINQISIVHLFYGFLPPNSKCRVSFVGQYIYSCTVYHAGILRAQFTGFLYVNKRNDIREPNIVLCLAVEFLSHGPSKKKQHRFYQAGSVIKPHCCLTSRNQLVLTACVRPFKPGTAGLIPGSLSLSDDTIN